MHVVVIILVLIIGYFFIESWKNVLNQLMKRAFGKHVEEWYFHLILALLMSVLVYWIITSKWKNLGLKHFGLKVD